MVAYTTIWELRVLNRLLGVSIVGLGLLTSVAWADFTKTIQVSVGTPAEAVTTWYYASCTQSLGLGSYSITVAPTHGALSFSTVSGPVPGCPPNSPSLPAAAAFYTWTDAASGAACDYFQLNYVLNGAVAEVIDINVYLISGPPLSITTTSLPSATSGTAYSVQLNSSAGTGVTWAVTSGSLPAGFTLSSSGLLSSSGSTLAAAGTYTVTVTASSSCQSTSQVLTLTVLPGNCATNASVDLSKIHVTVSPSWSVFFTVDDRLPFAEGDSFSFVPGTNLFGYLLPPYGITISADADAVTYTGPSVPTAGIVYKFVQNLENFTGSATYQEGRGAPIEEWNAILANSQGTLLTGPLVDYNGDNPPWYDSRPYLGDAPGIHVPISDGYRRSLRAIHYTKTFTAYFGCHTSQDLTTYTDPSEPKRYLHTLAKISWGVNYFGTIDILHLFGSPFTPDTSSGAPNTSTGPGTFFDSPVPDVEDPRMKVTLPTANGSTNYICFAGGVCP